MKSTTIFLAALAFLAGIVAGKKANDDVGYFWHFSDTHLYPQYKEGTNPTVGFCRTLTGKTGKYGNYNCDTPVELMDAAVKELIRLSDEPDFVLYGGDHISIFDTTQSKEMCIENIQNLTTYLKAIKAALPNTKIFPALGNHDVVPQFQFPETGPFYVYSTISEEWGQFLSEESVKTLNHSAFYTELISPGLRLVVLNTVIYYQDNLLVSRSLEDPAGQFEWMHSVLDEARKNGERVIVSGHVPPGTDYWSEFNELMLKAFDGYNDLIVGAFYGHTHDERLRIIKDVSEDGDSAHIAFVTSSVSPKYNVNPSITLYKYKKTYPFTILDRIPYYVNISDSEITGEIKWINSGSEAEDYGIEDFSTESVIKLVDRMEADDEVFTKYYDRMHFYYKATCSEKCKKNTLCEIRNPDYTLYKACKSEEN